MDNDQQRAKKHLHNSQYSMIDEAEENSGMEIENLVGQGNCKDDGKGKEKGKKRNRWACDKSVIHISEDKIRYKKFILKASIPANLLQHIKKHPSQLESMPSQKYQQFKMPQLTPYILEWQHSAILELYACHYNKIYKEVQDIRFPYLKYMNTWGNQIQSIQGICRVHWPALEQICLWDNKISSVAPLRRMHAPYLQWLDLKNNYIRDHEKLSEFWNPGKKFSRIHVTSDASLVCVVKVEGECFSDVQLRGSNKPGKMESIEKISKMRFGMS